MIVTRLVTSRIFWCRSSCSTRVWIAGVDRLGPPPDAGGVSALRTASTLDGLSGITWKVSGSGLEPSSW